MLWGLGTRGPIFDCYFLRGLDPPQTNSDRFLIPVIDTGLHGDMVAEATEGGRMSVPNSSPTPEPNRPITALDWCYCADSDEANNRVET